MGESALHNHDVTPKVRAAVTSHREEGGCCSTRKFCVAMRESIYMLLGLSSAPKEQCCLDSEGEEPDCVISFLST